MNDLSQAHGPSHRDDPLRPLAERLNALPGEKQRLFLQGLRVRCPTASTGCGCCGNWNRPPALITLPAGCNSSGN